MPLELAANCAKSGHVVICNISRLEPAETLAGFAIYTVQAVGSRSFSSETSREGPITHLRPVLAAANLRPRLKLALKQAALCGPFLVLARAEVTERRAAAAAGAAAQLWCCLVARARRCCAAFRWRARASFPAHPRARPPARFPSVGESACAARACSATAVPWPAAR